VSRTWFSTPRASTLVAGLCFLALLTASGARAQLSCPDGFVGQVFTFTETPQTFTLPANTSTLIVRAIGAGGGAGDSGGEPRAGGGGALIQGTFATAGGETLQILVGGAGDSTLNAAGGGGGATYVGTGASLAGSTPLVVAGGGGGGGRGDGATGGDGGAPGPTTPPSGTAGGDGGTDGGDGGAGDVDIAPGEPGVLGGIDDQPQGQSTSSVRAPLRRSQ